jgi:hypothetical protein
MSGEAAALEVVRAGGRKMELVIALGLMIALVVGAEIWGAESRDGFTSVVKPPRWFITPTGHGERLPLGPAPVAHPQRSAIAARPVTRAAGGGISGHAVV